MSSHKRFAVDLSQEEAGLQIYPRLPLLSSHHRGWHGIHVEYHCQPLIEYASSETVFEQHVIGVRLGPPTQQEMTFDGRLQEKLIAPSEHVIVPAGVPHGSNCKHECEYVLLCLDPVLVAQTAYEIVDPDHVELVPHFAQADPLMHGIGLALKAELEVVGSGDRLYAEAMAVALSAHLLRHYTVQKTTVQGDGRLPKYTLKRVLDYINANLDRDLALPKLAQAAGMSLYYFCRLFKQSMGMTPHQYLIRQRVERAKLLLRQKELTIATIALACGFGDHSHFTRHFRQLTGTTPKAYRKSL